jgi:hypothetical protein
MLRATVELRAMLLQGRTMSPAQIFFSKKAARLIGTARKVGIGTERAIRRMSRTRSPVSPALPGTSAPTVNSTTGRWALVQGEHHDA